MRTTMDNNRSMSRPGLLSAWYLRIPAKWCLFILIVGFVLFPYPSRLIRHLSHLSTLEAMVDPDAVELDAWAEEVLRRLAESDPRASSSASGATTKSNPRRVQRMVERLVRERVVYEWDWNTWGMADYMPTVREMFEAGRASPDGIIREDCDGRAVMAASLMRRLDYDASIVTDLRHVWVTTPQGEWMGPGRGKSITSSPGGNRWDFGTLLTNVPVSLSYGISVFPLWREIVILCAAWMLSLGSGMSRRMMADCGALLVLGLMLMRAGILAPATVLPGQPAWPAWIGLTLIGIGLAALWTASFRGRRRRAGAC